MQNKLMIYFENSQTKFPITYKLKRLMRLAVEATLAYEGYEKGAELSITFTDNDGIKRINKKFRKIDAPTDVLSFPLFDFSEDAEGDIGQGDTVALGDIVISLEKAYEQAEEFGHSRDREAAFLCVHSMLHLLGYDHVTSDDDDRMMRARQNSILEYMGITR